MVVGAFPVAKLLSLLVRQISKPIANYAKEKAKTTPFFRTYICMPPAQFYNWCEVKTKMWVLNLGRPINIPVLNEASAIELGANLLGEGIIFIIAAGVLISEYTRQIKKESAKEEMKKLEMSELNNKIQELYCDIAQQDAHIRELKRIILDLDGRVVNKPWIKKDSITVQNLDTPINDSPKCIKDLDKKNINFSYSNKEGVFLGALEYVEKEIIAPEGFNDPNDSLILRGLDYLHCHNFLISSLS